MEFGAIGSGGPGDVRSLGLRRTVTAPASGVISCRSGRFLRSANP